MFISIASAPACSAFNATSLYESIVSPNMLTISGNLNFFISLISLIKLSIPGLPNPTLFRNVPGLTSIIEGFLYPFLGTGPMDFEVTAPPPASINLFIEEEDTPKIRLIDEGEENNIYLYNMA